MDKKSPDAFRTISEVAEWLGVPTHVLRFWESRFSQVKPVKRAGGRRYYRPADMELLGGIRKLLHEDGMTIRGVQKLLREQGVKHVAALSPLIDSQPAPATDQSNVVSFGAARDDSAEDQPTTEPAALAEHPAAQDAMPAPEQAAEQPATQVGALSTAQPLSPSGTGDAPEIPVDPLEPIPQEDPTIAEAMATAASEQRPPFPVESAPIDALFSGEEMPEAPATTSAPLPSAPPVPSQATDVAEDQNEATEEPQQALDLFGFSGGSDQPDELVVTEPTAGPEPDGNIPALSTAQASSSDEITEAEALPVASEPVADISVAGSDVAEPPAPVETSPSEQPTEPVAPVAPYEDTADIAAPAETPAPETLSNDSAPMPIEERPAAADVTDPMPPIDAPALDAVEASVEEVAPTSAADDTPPEASVSNQETEASPISAPEEPIVEPPVAPKEAPATFSADDTPPQVSVSEPAATAPPAPEQPPEPAPTPAAPDPTPIPAPIDVSHIAADPALESEGINSADKMPVATNLRDESKRGSDVHLPVLQALADRLDALAAQMDRSNKG